MKTHSVKVSLIAKLCMVSISTFLSACGGGGGGSNGQFFPAAFQVPPETPSGPATPPQLSFADRCTNLVGQAVGTGTIVSTKLLDASDTQPQTCSAQGQIVSSATSTILFQLDLPVDGNWNRKLLQLGGGGYDGVVQTAEYVDDSPDGVNPRLRGYAIVGSDSGHQQKNITTASFALDNPTGFDNFAFKSHPLVYAAALDGIKSIYAATPEKKYFWGVSTGGREALLQAQRYPNNYDGIVAGMPAIDYSTVNQKAIHVAQLAYANNGAGWLSPAKVQLFGKAQLSACDSLDGLADNLILNWQACHFDPQVLRCPGGLDTGDTCLSDAQIATVTAIQTKFTLPVPTANGITSVPAYGIGGELDPYGWTTTFFGATANPPGQGLGTVLASEWLKYVVTSDPNASVFSYVPGSHAEQWQSASQSANATNPDLSAFNAHGGKLILFHGSTDALVPPGFSIDYYASVVGKFGQTAVDSFMRLFVVGSMGHTVGGTSAIDTLGALESWVEKGAAPDTMIASTPQATLSRPVCRYPYWAKYNGTGDTNSASSFTCAAM